MYKTIDPTDVIKGVIKITIDDFYDVSKSDTVIPSYKKNIENAMNDKDFVAQLKEISND